MSIDLNLKKVLLFLGDISLLYFSLLLTVFFGFWGQSPSETFILHLFPFSILYFFWLVIFYVSGLYDLHLIKTKSSFYSRLAGAFFSILVLGIIFFYSLPFFGITPKTNLIINVLIFLLLFIFWRNLFYYLFSSYFLNRIALIGRGFKIENLRKELEQRPYLGYKIVPVDLRKDIVDQIKKENVDTVIFTEEFESEPEMIKALYFYLPSKIKFLDLAQAYEIITEKIPAETISRNWLLEKSKEEKLFYDKIKRTFDFVSAIIILAITFPLWPLIALFIKLGDRGPVFYKQERVGKNRKIFGLLKFRSMIPGAEKEGPKWAEKEDKRTTKAGRFLRKTHLDEIPQMLNVIKGDISLTGPRPERPEFVSQLEKEIPHYHLRHLIKPGFTGWAQLKFRYGRSIIDAKEKFEYDLYYLKNRNFLLDIGILLKTFQLFFKRE